MASLTETEFFSRAVIQWNPDGSIASVAVVHQSAVLKEDGTDRHPRVDVSSEMLDPAIIGSAVAAFRAEAEKAFAQLQQAKADEMAARAKREADAAATAAEQARIRAAKFGVKD